MKKVFSSILALVLTISLVACSSEKEAASGAADPSVENKEAASNEKVSEAKVEPVKIVFGTGGTSGVYYPIGGALKTVFEASEWIKSVTVEATGASVKNIQNINEGLNQIAIVMSDVAYDAVTGTGNFEGNKIDVQSLAGLYPNVVQLVATKASGIKTVADLKGKRVGVGQVGSGVEASAKVVFGAAGMTYDDLEQVTHTGYADSVEAMKNSNLDAAFFTSGVPNSNISDIQLSMEIVFVPIDGEIAQNVKDAFPFYQSYVVPAGDTARYNLNESLNTVAIKNMLVVSPGLNEEVVYEMTKRFYDYLGTDTVSVGALKEFDRNDMGNGLVAPLHPGAKKFYEEKGLLK